MWRQTFTILRKIVLPPSKNNISNLTKIFYSTVKAPRSTVKLSLISASVGVLIGAGYGGYTHYKINIKRNTPVEKENYIFLKEAPSYKSQYRVINNGDKSNLQLTLFQYTTCPFCCKVRAYLDARGISYEVVEVDAVFRQAIKWSSYKKVPILLAKVNGGYQQLFDSTAIISILETYLNDNDSQLEDIMKFYPVASYINDSGKYATDVTNKYFIMHNKPTQSEKDKIAEIEERKWRQWADSKLVHTLSPNVYRTAAESLETFKWFEEAGDWRQYFPTWECTIMVYVGAAAMWLIAKRLKSRHHIKDDVRRSLYDAANEWVESLQKKKSRFNGGNEPNIADITVYGVLNSIEGCRAFQDLRNHTKIGYWYDDVKKTIESRRGQVITVHV